MKGKLAFPLLILNRKTKLLAVLSICLFHIGIGMGLYSFSITMMAIELLIFTDREYKNFKEKIAIYSNKILYTFKSKTSKFGETYLNKFKMTGVPYVKV